MTGGADAHLTDVLRPGAHHSCITVSFRPGLSVGQLSPVFSSCLQLSPVVHQARLIWRGISPEWRSPRPGRVTSRQHYPHSSWALIGFYDSLQQCHYRHLSSSFLTKYHAPAPDSGHEHDDDRDQHSPTSPHSLPLRHHHQDLKQFLSGWEAIKQSPANVCLSLPEQFVPYQISWLGRSHAMLSSSLSLPAWSIHNDHHYHQVISDALPIIGE